MGKEPRLAEERREDAVRDDARQDRGDQRVGLEVVPVEDLDGEEGGAEGCSEDRRHARAGAGHQAGCDVRAP